MLCASGKLATLAEVILNYFYSKKSLHNIELSLPIVLVWNIMHCVSFRWGSSGTKTIHALPTCYPPLGDQRALDTTPNSCRYIPGVFELKTAQSLPFAQ